MGSNPSKNVHAKDETTKEDESHRNTNPEAKESVEKNDEVKQRNEEEAPSPTKARTVSTSSDEASSCSESVDQNINPEPTNLLGRLQTTTTGLNEVLKLQNSFTNKPTIGRSDSTVYEEKHSDKGKTEENPNRANEKEGQSKDSNQMTNQSDDAPETEQSLPSISTNNSERQSNKCKDKGHEQRRSDKETKSKGVDKSFCNSERRDTKDDEKGHCNFAMDHIDGSRRGEEEIIPNEKIVQKLSQCVDAQETGTSKPGTYHFECPKAEEQEEITNTQQKSLCSPEQSYRTNESNEHTPREIESNIKPKKGQEEELNDTKDSVDGQPSERLLSNDVLDETKPLVTSNTADPSIKGQEDLPVTSPRKSHEKKSKRKKKRKHLEKSELEDSSPSHRETMVTCDDAERVRRLEHDNEELRSRIDALESEKQELNQQMNDRSHFRSPRHTATLKELREENEELKTRLSKIVSDRVTDGNPNITDLSDQNRPGKISERFWELYNNEWTDAIDSLNEQGIQDKDAVVVLLKIIVSIYSFCRNKADEGLRELELAIEKVSNCPEMTDELKLSMKLYKDYRKRNYKNAIIITEDTVKDFLPPEVKLTEKLDVYIRHGYELCWLMRIQDPPVHLEYDVEEDAPFDKVYFREYMRAGPICDYVVWPAMCLHKNGPILQKGVMQGTSSKSDAKM